MVDDLPSDLVGVGRPRWSGFLSPKTRWEILGFLIIPSLILGTAMSASHHAVDAHHDAGGAPAGPISAPPGPRGSRRA